jgi:prepilin-type N-terminal cleavage/methylation domain-containing protein
MAEKLEKGFTLVELLVVTAITAVGFIALITLQTAAIHGVTNSKDLIGAINLAEHLLNTIKIEALEWTNDTDQTPWSNNNFRYIKNLPGPSGSEIYEGNTKGWMPAYDHSFADKRVNQNGYDTYYDPGLLEEIPTFWTNPQGNVVPRGKRYCAQYRLTWIIPNILIRAEVRVLWVKEGATEKVNNVDYRLCPAIAKPVQGQWDMAQDTDNVYSVTMPAEIMKNIFVGS